MAQIGSWLSEVAWRVVSAPIRLKIVGIVVVMTGILGSAVVFQVETIVKPAMYDELQEQAESHAHSLATTLETPVLTGDIFSIEQRLEQKIQAFPDIRYVVVRDKAGRVLADSSGKGPLKLRPASPACPSDERQRRLLLAQEGFIAESVFPVLNGEGGNVQLGIADHLIAQQLREVRRSSLFNFGFSLLLALGLALILTDLFARPIRHLVEMVNEIGAGDFASRARVFSRDEVGRLAIAFNEMAERLEESNIEMKQKEEIRVALLRRIVDLQEDERKRLSLELHDHLGQSLLSLLLQVQLSYSGNERSASQAEIEERVRCLMGDVHRLAWGMRPSVLDDYGLDTALRAYIEETSRLAGVQIDYQYLDANRGRRLPSVIELTLYRVAQEALTNVVRHAQAARSSVVVLRQELEVTLIVEDDGRGFDPKLTNERAGGLGLVGMAERVAASRGRCDIESGENRGTAIRVRIPLTKGEDGDTNSTG